MTEPTNMHIGKKVQRIREVLGIKQDALAASLGITHQAISKIEQSEVIDDERLNAIANALKVTPESIKAFNEDAAVNFLNNITNNHFDNSSTAMVYQQHIHPVEKIVELYERMLKEKDLVIELYKKQQQAS